MAEKIGKMHKGSNNQGVFPHYPGEAKHEYQSYT
jgi:hypothetical protein